MKHRLKGLLALVLSLTMVFALATNAWATPATSVEIGGVTLNSTTPYWKNDGTTTTASANDYNAYFDNGILTLNGANIREDTYPGYGIYARGDLTISLIGDNKVVSAYDSGAYGVYCRGDLTIKGSGSLTAVGESRGFGIHAANIEITEGTVIAQGSTNAVDAPPSFGTTHKATASTNFNGNDPVAYDKDNIRSYKYLKIEPITYTVTFDANEHGTAPAAQSGIAAGGKVTEPADPTEAGWIFGGWYEEEACTNKWDFANDTVTADITLYAKWTENTYTVTFDANGGSGTMDAMTNEASVEFTYPACTFTAPAGKRFKGWSTDAESIEVIPVGTKHNLNGGDHLSLYAIWETIEDSTQQPADTYTISGTVVEKATAEPVTGAEVALKLGTTLIATETTDENGLFYFGGQKAGDYNVVVTSGDKVVTVLVALHDHDEDGLTVELPQTVTNSIVVHKTSEGFTAGTLVGGLDKVAQNLRKELGIATATDIEVKLTVADQKTSDIGEDVQKAIKKEASGKELLFFDLSVWKKIGTETQYMGEVSSLLEIYIPFDGSDKENVMVYRYHDNGAEVLPSVNKDSDREGYWVGDDGYIHILTNHFSTYAIGYTEKSDSQPSYNYPIYVAPVEDEAEQIASPQTFDAGITLPVVVTILGATGSAWLLRKKDD